MTQTSVTLDSKVSSLAWHRFNRSHDLGPRLFDMATDHYGEIGIYESWDEFWCFADDPPPFCVDSPAFATYAHFFVFNWLPDEDSEVRFSAGAEKPFARLLLDSPENGLTMFEKSVIEAALESQFTFFEIQSVENRFKLTVRDMFRGEVFVVDERPSPSPFYAGDILFGRILNLYDTAVFFPLMPLVFPYFHKEDILEFKRDTFGVRKALTHRDLFQHDFELRELCQNLAGAVLSE